MNPDALTLAVGVKYCGHCKPQRDMVELASMLQAAAPQCAFVRWSDPAHDVLLVLHACDVACAEIPDTPAPLVSVEGSMLNFTAYTDDATLTEAVITALYKAKETV